MPALETAAQTKYGREASMHTDFRKAISHRNFFRLGDVALQINGQEILAHRELLCRRCPFFRGLFQGYFKGGWLSERYSRMDSRSPIRIDLSHFEPKAFAYVLEHLYSDVGVEIFDNLVTQDLDTFGDIVLAVMDIANELMIDRLIEICQSILGRFVNMRNVANILNGPNFVLSTTLSRSTTAPFSIYDASAPKAERKISMTIPPPPTQPAQPLTEIFDEQIEQRARDQEKVRIRPLQEIIQEEQFLQWWEDEQKRIEQQEEDERKSMRLVHQLIAQESLGQPASSSGTKTTQE
ncbi:BTB/POZ domain-containing protein 1 [Ceratocystis platani]|uniref:BTB/POZ domain-containing protein 1 n=1 Tax=Ceratocystis fimbriata f. sp. platani TaxID=88771 RepID=A0A0F8DM64_CERFI|nr:BTB/POZ domain-containing protein 1 [Ceratocystis platani]